MMKIVFDRELTGETDKISFTKNRLELERVSFNWDLFDVMGGPKYQEPIWIEIYREDGKRMIELRGSIVQNECLDERGEKTIITGMQIKLDSSRIEIV